MVRGAAALGGRRPGQNSSAQRAERGCGGNGSGNAVGEGNGNVARGANGMGWDFEIVFSD